MIDVPFAMDDLPESTVEEKKHKVIQRENIQIKHLTVEEAAMQLDMMHKSFYVFNNEDTGKVNIITTHKDGTYGLIEP